jgi:hypothetical protein
LPALTPKVFVQKLSDVRFSIREKPSKFIPLEVFRVSLIDEERKLFLLATVILTVEKSPGKRRYFVKFTSTLIPFRACLHHHKLTNNKLNAPQLKANNNGSFVTIAIRNKPIIVFLAITWGLVQ